MSVTAELIDLKSSKQVKRYLELMSRVNKCTHNIGLKGVCLDCFKKCDTDINLDPKIKEANNKDKEIIKDEYYNMDREDFILTHLIQGFRIKTPDSEFKLSYKEIYNREFITVDMTRINREQNISVREGLASSMGLIGDRLINPTGEYSSYTKQFEMDEVRLKIYRENNHISILQNGLIYSVDFILDPLNGTILQWENIKIEREEFPWYKNNVNRGEKNGS